jgi:hypothetical protein
VIVNAAPNRALRARTVVLATWSENSQDYIGTGYAEQAL